MSKHYSEGIATAVSVFLEEEGLPYSFDNENGIFQFIFEIGQTVRRLHFILSLQEDAFVSYAYTAYPLIADIKTVT